jgi:hypothetical protein
LCGEVTEVSVFSVVFVVAFRPEILPLSLIRQGAVGEDGRCGEVRPLFCLVSFSLTLSNGMSICIFFFFTSAKRRMTTRLAKRKDEAEPARAEPAVPEPAVY